MVPSLTAVLRRIPDDSRLRADRHTNTVFPPKRFLSREEADRRREELVYTVRMAAGLVPWPEKTPLNCRREPVGFFDGFSVERVMFESRPGFWSTGNLFFPEPRPKRAPAILNVIGHWQPQRLTRLPEADYPGQIANFAKMGFVCLVTDMIGMVDSRQISHGYGGGEKELWLSGGLGVQLWNNIRALDLLCSLPEADPERIGVTGASGGGSQTLFLSLVDERIKAAAPINMISLLMQGGCTCENAPGLRRDTENGELCSLLAPRPLFLAGSTGDWTREQEVREAPAIEAVYRLYGAEENFSHYYQVADHQYNANTRRQVYRFFSKHLMGREIRWEEVPVDIGDVEDLTWFRGEGHAPGIEGDEAFFAAAKEERRRLLGTADREELRRMLAWITGIGEEKAVPADPIREAGDGFTVEKTVLVTPRGGQIPTVRLIPEGWDGKRLVLFLSGEGKACLGTPEAEELLSSGAALVSGDLFLTGESAEASVSVAGGGQGEQFFTTFHYTAEAYRAQDAAYLWKYVEGTAEECAIRASGPAARSVLCALPLLKGVASCSLDEEALALPEDAYGERFFLPGIMAVGGLDGVLKLAGRPE